MTDAKQAAPKPLSMLTTAPFEAQLLRPLGSEPDRRTFRDWWGHELPDGVKDRPEFRVILLFQLVEPAGQFLVSCQYLSQTYESPDHLNARLHGNRCIQHAGQHDRSVFREGIGPRSPDRKSVV